MAHVRFMCACETLVPLFFVGGVARLFANGIEKSCSHIHLHLNVKICVRNIFGAILSWL